MDLAFIWYIVICASVIMYAVLDGFDLGVGALYLFFRDDQERRILLNAIGPVWDGNELWLVIVIGGVLAGFTPVYATFLSGFYTPTMLLIFFIIFRAVAIEFRSKKEEKYWRKFWDVIFAFSSICMAFILGTAVGNLMLGLPLSNEQIFIGSLSLFFRLEAMVVGICAVALFTMHGGNYICMKTSGNLQEKSIKLSLFSTIFFFFSYLLSTLYVVEKAPWMLTCFYQNPILFLLPLSSLCSIGLVLYFLYYQQCAYAFIFSSFSVALLLLLFGIGTFPYLLRSHPILENSLTIYNAASSEKTLRILITMAMIGIPMVLCYGYWVYRVFCGKVVLDKQSY